MIDQSGQPRLTVAICTYNRAGSLRAAIGSVLASAAAHADYCELIVVDNNSSDETKTTVETFCGGPVRVRYLHEREQGLSCARNRALSEMNSDLILFTDDDVMVDEPWVEAYLTAAGAYPEAEFFGGRILVGWPHGKPGWLKDEDLPLLSGVLDKYDHGSEVREYRDDEPSPYGASFAIRRDLIDAVGSFRTDLGVKGTTPGRGEESDYLERARKAGFKGVYVGSAVCHHRADPARLRLGHLYRYGYQTGIAEARRGRATVVLGTRFRAALYGMRGIYQLLKGRGDRFRQCVINAGIQAGLRHAAGKG